MLKETCHGRVVVDTKSYNANVVGEIPHMGEMKGGDLADENGEVNLCVRVAFYSAKNARWFEIVLYGPNLSRSVVVAKTNRDEAAVDSIVEALVDGSKLFDDGEVAFT